MFLFKNFALFINLILIVKSENLNDKCPNFCKCDSYLQLNRATCSSKHLIDAEVDLPAQVQILDLSFNDITNVGKRSFEKFSHLKYLNLSNNALHTLDWESFSKLRRLIEIDLSHNRLEYLDERLFAKNKYLEKIDLEGNKLETLATKPILTNPYVREINLRNSQIFLLQPQIFRELTNLEKIDLSKNLLNNFNLEDFKYLENLREINLNENFIICDETIKAKLNQLKKQGVKVIMDNCLNPGGEHVKSEVQMFEKMVMGAPGSEEEKDLSNQLKQWRFNLELEDSEEEDDDNLDSKEILLKSKDNKEWLRFAPDAVLCNEKGYMLCKEYRSCLQDLNEAWHEQRKFKEKCPLNDIKFAFFLGIAIGVSAVIIILACGMCMKGCFEDKKRSLCPPPPPPLSENFAELSSQPLARPTTQLPPQVRRQPRRRQAPPARPVVRYEGPVGENFLSRLFGRPARQQYYRSINQNTATLIRRLSRSNLFNNRLSQHFSDRQNSSEPSSPEVEDFAPSAPRAETPPPSYGDVVINNCSVGK